MELTSTPMPEEDGGGKGWEQQLDELGAELQFVVVPPGQHAQEAEELPTLTLVSIYHKDDRELWCEIRQHLNLLCIAGHRLDHHIVPLTTDAESTKRWVVTTLARTNLEKADLVLLVLSVDLITALLQHDELCTLLGADDLTILPIALRPVFWSCPWTQLDPVPCEAVTVWKIRDQAHFTIAKTVHNILHITANVEEGNTDV